MAQFRWLQMAGFVAVAAAQIPLASAQELAARKPATAQQMAEYHRKLAAYTAAHDQFEAKASAYWTAIADKRRARNTKRRNGQAIGANDYVLRPLDANELVAPIHPKAMITILEEADWDRWLRGSYGDVVALQRPFSAERMTVRGPLFPTRSKPS